MAYIDFMEKLHSSTRRDYLKRVTEADKAECAVVSKKFDKEYWDGDRKYGYGGYYYDGRWSIVAKDMVDHYQLKPNQRVLDVGCGKGFLLYELKKLIPSLDIVGVDISQYAISNAKEEVREYLMVKKAEELDFEDDSFDLVISMTTLHNLYIYDLKKAIQDIQRISKKNAYIMMDSYRNETERMNLMYWQLTCECFYTPTEWEWLFKEWGYTGDYSFIYFQ